MVVFTNVDDEFILDKDYPLTFDEQGEMYITVRRNLTAKVHRNMYYQWVEIANEVKTEKGTEIMFNSANCNFSLGTI